MTSLFEWADQREADHRAVLARIAYWEAQPNPPAELLEKFRHADAVMRAGGECPMRRATLLTVLEAIAAVGLLIGTAVGPNRPTNRSPVELVAQFAERDIPVPPRMVLASHARRERIHTMIHSALTDAGVDVERTAQHGYRERGMT